MNLSSSSWRGLVAFPVSLAARRSLILRLTRRRIETQYKGSILGRLWPFIQPLLLLAVYTFVFSIVFELRWGPTTGGRMHFALVLLTGLIVFNLVNHCLIGATTVVREQPAYVKRVVFPLEVLPVIVLLEGMVYASISYAILVTAALLSGEGLSIVGVVATPVAMLPLLVGTLGVMWFVAALAVYVRDLAQFVGVATMILLFVCPIFYPLEMVPGGFRTLILLNPLTFFVTSVRGLLFDGAWPSVVRWLGALAAAYVLAVLGYSFFARARRGFSDVI